MALRNQPYLPLYVNDFMNDEKLKPCSAESTGVYIRVMCLLHKCDEYGILTFNELDARTDDICYDFARVLLPHLPYTLEVIHRGLKELTARKVLTIDGERLSQKRMVKDGNISASRAAAGFSGGKSKADRSKQPSKTLANDVAKVVASSDNETDTVSDTYSVSNGFGDSDDLLQNAQQLNAVFDAAERAGFPRTQADLDRLNLIVADYGADAVINAIGRAVDQGTDKRTWAYLRGILKSDPTGGTQAREPKWEPPMQREFEG